MEIEHEVTCWMQYIYTKGNKKEVFSKEKD